MPCGYHSQIIHFIGILWGYWSRKNQSSDDDSCPNHAHISYTIYNKKEHQLIVHGHSLKISALYAYGNTRNSIAVKSFFVEQFIYYFNVIVLINDTIILCLDFESKRLIRKIKMGKLTKLCNLWGFRYISNFKPINI